MTWPDYEKAPIQIWDEQVFEVFDPWTAQVIGLFYTREDAESFAKLYVESKKQPEGD